MQHKIGIYVRVSSEEQAQVVEGSIESQQHRIRSFVDIKFLQDKSWGKIIETYIDDGFSAKNTKRPAYQRMIRDIRTGKINFILITDLSRLSRNIADFCLLLKELELYKAKFLSIKEQFDTSTPAGEMMIFNMINLAQFERKQTSERISLNFNSRALRGLVNGGTPVLGYDREPTNPGKMFVNESEREVVKYIFDTYLEEGSLSKTVARLNVENVKRKVTGAKRLSRLMEGKWTISSLQLFLKNLTYIGKREVNKANKNCDSHTLKSWHKHQVVNASWPAIISERIFCDVQKGLDRARVEGKQRLNSGERRDFLLSGLIKCGECGRSLIGHAAHGKSKIYRYYGHKKQIGDVISCSVSRLPADEVEHDVIRHLGEILVASGYLDQIESNIEKTIGLNKESLKIKYNEIGLSIIKVTAEIESAFKLMTTFDSNTTGADFIRNKFQELTNRKKEMENDLQKLTIDQEQIVHIKTARKVIEERLIEFKRGWKKATPNIKKRLIRGVLNTLVYSAEALKIFFVLEEENQFTGIAAKTKKPLGSSPSGFFNLVREPMGFLMATFSPVVVNGGSNKT
jgi:site-specific DNA recombinase